MTIALLKSISRALRRASWHCFAAGAAPRQVCGAMCVVLAVVKPLCVRVPDRHANPRNSRDKTRVVCERCYTFRADDARSLCICAYARGAAASGLDRAAAGLRLDGVRQRARPAPSTSVLVRTSPQHGLLPFEDLFVEPLELFVRLHSRTYANVESPRRTR